jgi:uncharacterized membrane protein YoaK (UPF0700 family)
VVTASPREGAAISSRAQAFLLMLLSAAAASIDAISYLGLGGVFTANMTGNTVLLALSAVQGELRHTQRSLTALVGFAVGAAAAAIIVRTARRPAEWPPSVTLVTSIEVVLLGILAATWGALGATPGAGTFLGLIALCAVPMGMQSAAIRSISGAGVATTFITGTWTDLLSGLVGMPGTIHQRRRRAGTIAAYIVGAAGGGVTLIYLPHWAAVLLPTAILAVAATSAALLVSRSGRWWRGDQSR